MSAIIVETTFGKVQGERVGDVSVWRGIPYAKPPLGPLRFQAPEPPESWSGIRDATTFGPVAAQESSEVMAFLGNKTEGASEDCLYLNIWSPEADGKKRPVMVWIHGGAYVSGAGSSEWYDGASFAEQGNVVIVTINYRLGIMGFLHLAEFGGEHYQASGNCGILDQVAALKWVKENIATFGGDPEQVTIFGESAGAVSVGTLLTLPLAKGLFQKAILESGTASFLTSEKATATATELLSALNVDTSDLSKLESIPIEQLIKVSKRVPTMGFGPVLDGKIIPVHHKKALAEGAAKDITILVGTNKDEYNLYSIFDTSWKNADEEAMEGIFKKTFGPLWPGISEQFRSDGLSQALFNQLMTHFIFTAPAIRLAEAQVRHGVKVFMYRFDWETPIFGGALKSCHALEIPFVFNTINKPGTTNLTGTSPSMQEVAGQMHRAWIQFAKTGDPNTGALPVWPEYNLVSRATMLFNTESKAECDPNGEIRKKWNRVTALAHKK